jgi:hypothetical protein
MVKTLNCRIFSYISIFVKFVDHEEAEYAIQLLNSPSPIVNFNKPIPHHYK